MAKTKSILSNSTASLTKLLTLLANIATLPAQGIQSLLAQVDSPLLQNLHNWLFCQLHPNAKAEAKPPDNYGHVTPIFTDFKQRESSASQTLSEVGYHR